MGNGVLLGESGFGVENEGQGEKGKEKAKEYLSRRVHMRR